jgi:hypothetical protein
MVLKIFPAGRGACGEDEVRGICADRKPAQPALPGGGAPGTSPQSSSQTQVLIPMLMGQSHEMDIFLFMLY